MITKSCVPQTAKQRLIRWQRLNGPERALDERNQNMVARVATVLLLPSPERFANSVNAAPGRRLLPLTPPKATGARLYRVGTGS